MSNEDRPLLLVGAAVALVLLIPLVAVLSGAKGVMRRDLTTPPAVSTPAEEGGANASRLARAAAIDGARIVAADAEPGNWLAHGRTYGEQRFSPLDKIHTGNVKELGLAWSYATDTVRGLEASPIVADGVMFATGSWSVVYALDAKTGEELWKYDPEVPREWGRKPCCDVVNRGVAVWKGRVYVGTLDGRLVALDARTGKPVWDVNTIDRTKPYTITGAPRIVKGKVIIGNGGAELGVRGYITAYDAETGRQLWRFFTVPTDPRLKQEGEHLDKAVSTWKPEGQGWKYWEVGGGGTVWDSMAYDPDLDLLYIGTGNGSPWSRYVRSPGGGANLYVSSIIAIKPDSGEMLWYYQTTPGDTWDFTATQHLILADLQIEGQLRKVIMQAPKNGFFYVLDRQTGEFISAKPYVAQNWTKGIDEKTGLPLENPEGAYRDKPAIVYPAPTGGHNWQPMAYSPNTHLVYVPAQESAQPFLAAKGGDIRLGVWNTGLDFPGIAKLAVAAAAKGAPPPVSSGYLLAWDPINQKEAWKVKHATFWNGGILTTAGNLVFQGLGDGTFNAWSADKGDKMWSVDTHTGIIAPPITYTVDGEQYVAVLAGWGGAQVALAPEPAAAVNSYGNNGKIFAFKIGGTGTIEAQKIERGPMVQPPEVKATAAVLEQGGSHFHRFCAVCHGFLAISGGVVPDLRYSAPEVFARFKEIVLDGERAANGMASFADQLKPDEVDAIKDYVLYLANAEYRKANNIPDPAPVEPPAEKSKPARRGSRSAKR